MKTLKMILTTTILMGVLYADTKKENDLLMSNINELSLCSASYYIRTATTDPEAVNFFKSSKMMIDALIGAYFRELKGFNPTNGQITKFSDISLNALEKSYREEKKVLPFYINKFAKCDGALMYYIQNSDTIDKNLQDPTFSKREYLLNELSIFNHKAIPINEELISQNFDLWVNKNNAMTPTKFKESLRKDLEKSGHLK